jgi:hypothetical protein
MDADKITSFFKFHIEKMILVVVIGASVFMLYQGFDLPHYTDKHKPDQLAADATQVRNAIDEDHNEMIIPERVPSFDIVAATARRDQPVEHTHYRLDYPWQGKGEQSIVRRTDPLLPPPAQLLAQGVTRIIAVRRASDEYAILALEGADPVEKVEVKKREPRRRRGRGMDEDMMMMMEGMEDEMMDGMDEMDMMDSASMSGSTRKFDSSFDFGVRPLVTDDKKFPHPQVAKFIAGTAVIPHKKLYEHYEQSFKDADGYDPRRDTPFYYNFEVQRADVTSKPVDQLVDADWVDVWSRHKYTVLGAKIWSGFAPEVVPEDYRDDLITTWIPPVLMDDYRDFCLHPSIPMKSKAELKREEFGQDEVIEDVDVGTLFEENDQVLVAPGMRSRGGAMDDYGGMDDYGDMDMGMGFTLGIGPRGIEIDPVDYKLLRFYDFVGFQNSPQSGRKYVYRLRYSVNDPNFPANPEMQPQINTLTPETTVRIVDLMAQAQQTNTRSFQRWTEWSEPCAPVSLADSEDFYAGSVQPGTINDWDIGGRRVSYMRDPPSGKILATQYDPTYATRVPMTIDVTEGTVLSQKVDKDETVDVVDAVTLEVKKLPEAELISPTTVVDLDGGRKLAITDGLTEPGMMLLYDNDGQLTVTDDISDQEYYRIYTYAKERGE